MTKLSHEEIYQAMQAKGCGDPNCRTHRENKYTLARTKPATIHEHFRNVAYHYFERDHPTGKPTVVRDEPLLRLIATELEVAYWHGRQDEWRVQSEECPGAVDDEPYRGTEKP